mmetsp:Transcript_21225/g.48759  ORF Transcript_21225/g.48759 Transcript_21225/m.48759 type:complete len:130 (-) Transcript_21225:49-438(-)
MWRPLCPQLPRLLRSHALLVEKRGVEATRMFCSRAAAKDDTAPTAPSWVPTAIAPWVAPMFSKTALAEAKKMLLLCPVLVAAMLGLDVYFNDLKGRREKELETVRQLRADRNIRKSADSELLQQSPRTE